MNHVIGTSLSSRRRERRQFRHCAPAVACLIAIASPLLITGCAPLMNAQSELVVQARRGVELAQANRATCEPVHAELARVKRQRLDDAFDADVLERERGGALTADWVIAHRTAYGAALSAYARQEHALAESDNTARRNLHAVDAALERLQWLQSIQNRWLTLPLTAAQPQEQR